MIYNLSEEPEKAIKRFKKLLEEGAVIELKKKVKSRSSQQNSALHLYFSMIASALNDCGMEYQYSGLKGDIYEIPYNEVVVKEFIWRPIQIALFNIESTTKINTEQMNQIIDVITKFFAERSIVIEFPSIETLIN